MMLSQLLFALVTSINFFQSNASSLNAVGSFYTVNGPVILSLDRGSGELSYNIYGQTGYSAMQSVTPVIAPRNDTAIAVTGYQTLQSIYASIFYQAANSSIVQQAIKCNYISGLCGIYEGSGFNGKNGSLIISSNVTTPIKPGTAIAASLFSTNFGYRITYEDIHGSLRQLSYSYHVLNKTLGTSEGTKWADGRLISNSSSLTRSALATTQVMYTINGTIDTQPSHQTVYRYTNGQIQALYDDNVRFPNATVNDTWVTEANISASVLPNFDPAVGTFSVVLYRVYIMLFYIDKTRQLQYVRSTDYGLTWQVQPLEKSKILPLADVASASLSAAASINASDSSMSVFYESGGKTIQAEMHNAVWEPDYVAVALPFKKDMKKITIGASAGAGAAFILLVGYVGWFVRRRRRFALCISSSGESFKKWNNSDTGAANYKAELHNDSTQIYELDHDPECLLLHQLQAYRMYEARGEIPVEIEGNRCTGGRFELDHTLCKCELDAAPFCELPTFCETKSLEEDSNSNSSSLDSKSEHSDGATSSGPRAKDKGKAKEGSEGSNGSEEMVFSLKNAVVQLPMWSWAILRREVDENGKGLDLDLEKGDAASTKSGNK